MVLLLLRSAAVVELVLSLLSDMENVASDQDVVGMNDVPLDEGFAGTDGVL